MRRTDDFAKLVDASDVDAAKKTVAMILVDACRPLENGGAADVGSLSRAFLAMVPLQLEQYLGASKAGRAAVFSVRRLAFEVAKGAGPWGVLLYLLIDYKDVIVELVMR
jgi:hypothetical protein